MESYGKVKSLLEVTKPIKIVLIFRLTYNYKLVGMMLYEKLVERDIDPLSLPSETVRLHLLQKYIQ